MRQQAALLIFGMYILQIKLVFSSIFSALNLSCVLALYSKSDDVIELTEKNFKSEVLDYKGVVVVEFYAPWFECNYFREKAFNRIV